MNNGKQNYIAPSELIINSDGSVFHLHIRPEQLADNVILLGDQDRVPMAAKLLDTIEFQGRSREFNFVTGKMKGVPFTILSTGIGTDNIDIVLNELDVLANVDFTTRKIKEHKRSLNIVRVGTSGTVRPEIKLGDLVYSYVSLGFDSLLNWYAPCEQFTNKAMQKSFMEYMSWPESLHYPYFVDPCERLSAVLEEVSDHKGITISAPGFYGPQGRVLRLPIVFDNFIDRLQNFEYNGLKITNIEMEASAIAGLSRCLGHNYGTVCLIIAQRDKQDMNTDYKPLMVKALEKVFNALAKFYSQK